MMLVFLIAIYLLLYEFQIFGGSRDIKFSVWDIEGSEEYTLIHHSVYTEYSLYLLVWDFWSIEKDITDIACWLYNIQVSYEPRCEKTGLQGVRPGPTQTKLYSHRR